VKRARQISKDISSDHRVITLAGHLSLSELPLALKGLDVLVTNDTGPFHVAVALQTPTISLFVPSSVYHAGPYQDLHLHSVIQKPRPCSPCVQKYCAEPDCMASIGVEEVFRRVLAHLEQHVQEKSQQRRTLKNA